MSSARTGKKAVSYAKWGYIFLAPFFITFCLFSLYPLLSTFYYSFFEHYRDGLDIIGPNFVMFDNYKALFEKGLESDIVKYFGNTFILWLLGFVPQIVVSLLFAKWFTDLRLKLKATGFFKVVIYMPNIIMASSMALLFFTLFSDGGPVNTVLLKAGMIDEKISFFSTIWGTRGIICFINFIMWYGNTTILLMAAIMGVDVSLYESAQIDGANASKIFFKITLPLITPILLFVVITSMLGGIQMFDIPQVMTMNRGDPVGSSMTVVMFLNNNMANYNVGASGAVSVAILAVSIILSIIVFKINTRDYKKGR